VRVTGTKRMAEWPSARCYPVVRRRGPTIGGACGACSPPRAVVSSRYRRSPGAPVMTPERYKVRVTKDHLVFCCGHFISYEGSLCERLHGHNYRAAVEVEGPLDPANYYLFDFVALKHRTKALTDELDHHMLLATENP